MLERWFKIREAGSTPGRELLGGLTTFLTMAYIIFVNPIFLEGAGISHAGAVLATCLGAILGTLLMAFLANYPIALAPGMGMNAFFLYTIVKSSGVPWPTALGLCFWSGVLFVLVTITGAREIVVRAVPATIKLSAAVGIGLFIALIGLQHGGIVADHPATLISLGDLGGAAPKLALSGLLVTLVLMAAKIRTAIFWGVAATAALAWIGGALPASHGWTRPTFDLPGFQIDLWGALKLKYLPLVLVLLFFSIFDTLGTLMAVAHEAGFLKDGQLPRVERALLADSLATAGGSLLGTSTVTSYIESGAGVAVGARTGLANVVTALLFAAAIFVTPLVEVIGRPIGGLYPITAPALVAVGILMARAIGEIRWSEMSEAIPAFLTMVIMPATFNISHGLAVGILSHVVVRVAARRWREVHWLMYVLAALIVYGYARLPIR
jgi:AGZA family xanthine/uracil permease-like MFS transporter